ncbi:MAG: hypothetical protein V4622_11295 [Bacteroidota bacterium]
MKLIFLIFSTFLFLNTYSQTFSVGDNILVSDNTKNYGATILKIENDKYYVKYDIYDESYNEWVTQDRLHKRGYKVGAKLEGLETDGLWYAITILEVGDEKYRIHWEGFEDSYDRWIEAVNVRVPENKTNSESSTRISIVYLENKTGTDIRYSFSGDGSSGGSSIFKNQTGNIKNAPIGGNIEVNGKFYIKITKAHDGQTIIIR